MRFSSVLTAMPFVLAAAPAWGQSLYTEYGDPTAAEQLVLEIINRARANPTAEGTRLASFAYPLPGGDITEGLTAAQAADVGPRPPLAMNEDLLSAARAHSQDMWTRVFFAHVNPDGDDPADRVTAAGYAWTKMGENIATSGSATADWLEDLLMVDPNFTGRGHRRGLLDIDPSSAVYYREVGIGYYAGAFAKDFPPAGPGPDYKDFLTENFGRRAVGPFVVGVVHDDINSNSFYDIGEGLSGVTVRLSPAGAFYAVSASAGGYAFPIPTSGTITVQATGGPFGATVVSKVVSLSGENVKVDFKLSEAADTDADGLPDTWEQTHFGNLAQTASGDPDGDTFTNLQEMQAGSDPNSAASVPPPPDDDDDDDKGCGSIGLDLLWPLGLLWLRRRLRN